MEKVGESANTVFSTRKEEKIDFKMCYASSTAEGRPLLLPVELTSVETNVDVGPPGGGGAVV